MSFSFPGTTNGRLFRSSGNVDNTNAFTTAVWVKRTVDFLGLKTVFTYRPGDDSTGHDIVINNPNDSPAYSLTLQANYASAQAFSEVLVLNTWTYIVIVGSGTTITMKFWDGAVWINDTVGQTAFIPGHLRIGDAGAGTSAFTGKMAHIRVWDAILTDAELNAERVSATRVRSANSVSSHSGSGADITAALTGESGTAFSNAGGVTLDAADNPSLVVFTGALVTGDSDTPSSVPVVVGARYNYLLSSDSLAGTPWALQSNLLVSGAVAAPVGYGPAQRIQLKNSGGGIYQMMTGLPEGRFSAVGAFRRVDSDFVVFRHVKSDFSIGIRGIFSLVTGAWGTYNGFGGITATALSIGVRPLTNGWWLLILTETIAGNRGLEFYPVLSEANQGPALDKYVDVCGFQYEEASADTTKPGIATYHKTTTTTKAQRTLASATTTLATPTIGVGQSSTGTIQLLDNTGAPWDQDGPVTVLSSAPSIATATIPGGTMADVSGRAVATIVAIADGTTNISGGKSDGVQSSTVVQTVGTAVTRRIRVLVEPGWEGTSGWFVGFWTKHVSQRFPSAFLFEKGGQRFATTSYTGGLSVMDVDVPSGISLTVGQIVEVALENDSINGAAVDGPGIFSAEVY